MLSEYERLERTAYRHRILLLTNRLPQNMSGLYYSNKHHRIKAVTLNSSLETTAQKACTLAEELGHHFTVPINLIPATKTQQNKYEKTARLYAAKRLISFDKLIKAKKEGVRNRFELAEYLDVTEEFLDQTLSLYSEHYGLDVCYKGYIIVFKPLDVKKVYYKQQRGGLMPIQKVSEGKYRIWVSAGRGSDGKRVRYSKTIFVKNDEAAEKQLKAFEKEVLKDELPLPRNMSFKQLWELYIRDHVELNDSLKTKEWYKNLSFRILPALGHMQASAIQPLNISNFYTALKNPESRFGKYKGGVSAVSLKHYHRALKAVFNFGVSYKIIKDNPMQSIKAPKTPKSIPDAYDDENINVFFEAISKEPLKWQTLCMLAVSSGMRREEIAGLKWSDVNFDKKTISIQRAVIYIPKQPLIVDTTKTETSVRTITVSDISLAQLLSWKEISRKAMLRRLKRISSAQVVDAEVFKYCETLRDRIKDFDNEYIWNQYDGSPLNPDSITSYWRKLRKKYNLPDVTFKGLRHTSATLAIANGADIRNLAKRFGHADPTMILRVYAEAVESADKRIANTWDNIITEKSKWHKDGTFSENKDSSKK